MNKIIAQIEQFPKDIEKIVDFYFPHETAIWIPLDNKFLHFLNINGIYLLYSKNKINYVGISSNIGSRVRTHYFNGTEDRKEFTDVIIIRFQENIDIIPIEARLIDYFNPIYNRQNQHLSYSSLPIDFDSKKFSKLIEEIKCLGIQ